MALGRSALVQRHPLNLAMNLETVNRDPLTWGLGWHTLDEFIPCGALGSERQAAERVARLVRELGIESQSLQRIKVAVAQAVLNVIDHSSHQPPESQVCIRVMALKADSVTLDSEMVNSQQNIAQANQVAPTMHREAELSSRSWGFFLVGKSKGALLPTYGGAPYTIELFLYPEGDGSGSEFS